MAVYNLGLVGSTPVTRNRFNLNPVQPTDVFRFRTIGTRNLNIALTGITPGDDADLNLFRDVNNNNILDAVDRRFGRVASSVRGSNLDDSLNLSSVPAGQYFAEVRRFAPGSSGHLNYNLAIQSTFSRSSNVLHTERNFGNLSGDRTQFGRVTRIDTSPGIRNNTDTNDTYRFSLGLFEAVNIRLDGLTSDADVRVIRDRDNDGLVDPGEVVGSSTRGGTLPELISNINLSGNYFVQVYGFTGNTNYRLTLDHFNTPGQP